MLMEYIILAEEAAEVLVRLAMLIMGEQEFIHLFLEPQIVMLEVGLLIAVWLMLSAAEVDLV